MTVGPWSDAMSALANVTNAAERSGKPSARRRLQGWSGPKALLCSGRDLNSNGYG
jgi:hypothetical protein